MARAPWWRRAALAVVVAALALGGAAAGRPAPAGPGAAIAAPLLAQGTPPLQPVRVGVVLTASEVGIHLAAERGYFAEQGLSPEYTRFDSAAFAVAPLSTGELDVASGVVSAALFSAINRGVEVRLVAPLSRYDLGYSQLHLNVRRDLAQSGAIRDYADLRGRTLAVMSLGSTVELIAERLLAQGGLTPADVSLVQLGAGDQLAAFAGGAIDVGLLTEPQATIADDRGLAVKWREAAAWTPGVQVSNILYGPTYVSRNPDAGQRFLTAYLRGLRDYYDAVIAGRADRGAVIDTLIRNTPLQDRALYDRMSWVYVDPNLALDENDLRATMQWFVDRGLLDRPADLGVAVDRRFADYALRALGPYR